MDPDIAGGNGERFSDAVRLEDAGAATMARRVITGGGDPMAFANWLESHRTRQAQLRWYLGKQYPAAWISYQRRGWHRAV